MVSHGATMERIQLDLPISDRFDSLLDAIRHAVYTSGKQIKYLEADLGKSPGWLSRRLSENPNDDAALPASVLEAIIEKTGNLTPIYYLVNKYLRPKTDADLDAVRELREHLPLLKQVVALLDREGKR